VLKVLIAYSRLFSLFEYWLLTERRPSWNLAAVVLIISMGLGLLVAGETEFNLAGFLIVMVASALSGLRWTITQVLLQGNNAHGTGELPELAKLPPCIHSVRYRRNVDSSLFASHEAKFLCRCIRGTCGSPTGFDARYPPSLVSTESQQSLISKSVLHGLIL
jgi:hypothetical protein